MSEPAFPRPRFWRIAWELIELVGGGTGIPESFDMASPILARTKPLVDKADSMVNSGWVPARPAFFASPVGRNESGN